MHVKARNACRSSRQENKRRRQVREEARARAMMYEQRNRLFQFACALRSNIRRVLVTISGAVLSGKIKRLDYKKLLIIVQLNKSSERAFAPEFVQLQV